MNVKAVSLLACLLVAPATSAFAQDAGNDQACRPDSDRLCSKFYNQDVKLIYKCLDDNVCRLSAACQASITQYARCKAKPKRKKY